MKQTAVEWLESKLYEFETIYDSLPPGLYEYVAQAKEIEKQQIIDAGNSCAMLFTQTDNLTFGEQYYNEKFLNNNKK